MLLLLAGHALAAHLPVVLYEHLGDRTVALYIDEADLAATPDWGPGQGPVPLAVDEVISLVDAWRRGPGAGEGRLRISEIILRPIESPRYGSRWHYVVALRRMGDVPRDAVHGRRLYLAVLFDRKVVRGVVEPAP